MKLFTFDIETVALPMTQEEAEDVRAHYEPPSNWKNPEVIERGREGAVEKALERRKFEWYGCRPVSAAFYDVQEKETHSFASEDSSEVAGWIASFLNGHNSYSLAGHNIIEFDLKVTWAWLVRIGIPLRQKIEQWDRRVIDTCAKGPTAKMKLKVACSHLGLPIPDMDGSGVAALYEAGNLAAIREYNEQDVRLEAALLEKISYLYKL